MNSTNDTILNPGTNPDKASTTGEKIALWAIIAMVVYLFIAQ